MRVARGAGFSLIEVLAALAIVAVALGAGLRATAVTADNTLALKERTLAHWVAANELTRVQSLPALPPLGEASGESEQAGERFVWHATIDGTPNPDFRRVTLRVRRYESSHVLAEVQGFAVGNR